jgi:cell division protein ZapE
MSHRLLHRFRAMVEKGDLKPDALQEKAAARLDALAHELGQYRYGWRQRLFGTKPPPRGLYIWGDVGRGKSMLMDLLFQSAPVAKKRRIHFNAFMAETHARIHAERQREGANDPIPPVARLIAQEAALLCFDEFQVEDVADAMILGRLFTQLFEAGVVVVATSNTAPDALYRGGLNRQLFLPFIALLKERLDVAELNGPQDYRMQDIAVFETYITPLGPQAQAAMDAAWSQLTGGAPGKHRLLTVLGRELIVPCAFDGVARFSFTELCERPLGAIDYLTLARTFHTVLIDAIPKLSPAMRDAARRFILLIDTLYDEGVALVCSAEAPPEELYTHGDGTDAFRRTVSRLTEMQSADYPKSRAAG